MRIWKKFSLLVLAVSAVHSASAISFSDVDLDGQNGEPHYKYLASWGSSNWNASFNLLDAGFDPLTMRVISATVSFAFADDGYDSWDYAGILVGGTVLWSWQDVDGSHRNAPSSYDWFSRDLGDDLVAQLQDGVVDYSVKAQFGDFYLKEASIVAEVELLKVPDAGTTISFLSLGIAVILILRRQMKFGSSV